MKKSKFFLKKTFKEEYCQGQALARDECVHRSSLPEERVSPEEKKILFYLYVYIVRPARMRSSFPLLEPGPPRFFWWYENSE